MKQLLITGATGGIGKAILAEIAHLKYEIVALSRKPRDFLADCEQLRHECVDFAKTENLEPKLKNIAKTTPALDTIIINAGVGYFGELEQLSFLTMKTLMNVNFLSQALLIKTFLPILKKHATGNIIVIGSEAACKGAKKASLYCASKFALRGFCQSLRHECLTKGINISLINPGLTDTPFFDTLDFRPGSEPQNYLIPQQIAKAVTLILTNQHPGVYDEINLSPLKNVIQRD